MRTKVKVMKKEVLAELPTGECHHYWLIESAKGHTSRGVCKLCGASKEFFNSIPEAQPVVAKRRIPFQELPELNVEPDHNTNNS